MAADSDDDAIKSTLGQRRADAGRPGKTEGKSKHQRHQRIHPGRIDLQMQAMLPGKPAVLPNPQLIDSEPHDQDASDDGNDPPVFTEKLAKGRKSQTQKKKGKADSDDKTYGVQKDLSLLIVNASILRHCFCSPGKISDIQRHKRQHAG